MDYWNGKTCLFYCSLVYFHQLLEKLLDLVMEKLKRVLTDIKSRDVSVFLNLLAMFGFSNCLHIRISRCPCICQCWVMIHKPFLISWCFWKSNRLHWNSDHLILNRFRNSLGKAKCSDRQFACKKSLVPVYTVETDAHTIRKSSIQRTSQIPL